MLRATFALALAAGLAWSCLLLGIGLDDLTDGNTKPGVVFAIVVLSLLIAGLGWAMWRFFGAYVSKRITNR